MGNITKRERLIDVGKLVAWLVVALVGSNFLFARVIGEGLVPIPLSVIVLLYGFGSACAALWTLLDVSSSAGLARKTLVFVVPLAVLGIHLGLNVVLYGYDGPSPISTTVSPQVVERSVVVLPFVDLGDDPGQSGLPQTFTQSIVEQLAQDENLTTVRSGGAEERDTNESAFPTYVVEGSVRRNADRFRVAVQITDSRTQAVLWSEVYDGSLAEAPAVQAEIAGLISETLK